MSKDKEMLTETQAAAECLYSAISESTTFGAGEAKKVASKAQEMLASGLIDAAMFAAIITRFGNHSATRQRLEKYGWFTKTIQKDALEVEMRRLQSMDTEA